MSKHQLNELKDLIEQLFLGSVARELNVNKSIPIGHLSLEGHGLLHKTSGLEFMQDINVTVTAYNVSNQVIASHTLTNVPMKQNRRTIATGKFFSASGSGSFTFNTAWETGANMEY